MLEKHEEDFIGRVEFKSTSEFLSNLNSYAGWLKRDRFMAEDIPVRFKKIHAAYLKMQLEGSDTLGKVNHLIVDEMQDYTAVQYAVLSRLFPCNKTILGDANQNVDPYSSTTSDDIKEVFTDAQAVTLTKSYRSTWEITRFAKRISPLADADPVERHGEEPEILVFDKVSDENRAVLKRVQEFRQSDDHTLGILCKTQKQA